MLQDFLSRGSCQITEAKVRQPGKASTAEMFEKAKSRLRAASRARDSAVTSKQLVSESQHATLNRLSRNRVLQMQQKV